MTRNPDTALTLVLLAVALGFTIYGVARHHPVADPRPRLSDAQVRVRFPAIAERVRARHYH